MASVLNVSFFLLAFASISACGSAPPQPQAGAVTAAQASERLPAPASAPTLALAPDMCDPNAPAITIDAYKVGVAHHILRTNLGHTFEGRLPPMLPAVVVLRLSVNPNGAVIDAFVQRSRDDVASRHALASVQRAGYFPAPCGLANGANWPFSFSETFLFNDKYEFQLRSLAGPQ